MLLRGRRRVGKSRLAEQFAEQSGLPYVYFQAARHAAPADEWAALAQAVAASDLPDAEIADAAAPGSFSAALTLLATALPDRPSIVILDELPWLLEGTPGGAGQLQRVWDRRLSRKPVLMLLLGSDLTLMEQLAGHNQPFHGGAAEMVLEPLNPRDVAAMTGLAATEAFDAHLITGGLPLVAQEWRAGMTRKQLLTASYSSSTSALVVNGSRILDAEFPASSVARRVLNAIGSRGERTFTKIQQGTGMHPTTLTDSLRLLGVKRVVAADVPLSTKASPKEKRYRVSDPALRFWLAFVAPALDEIDRGRRDLALDRVVRAHGSWRGRAIEPVVRDALMRLLPDERWPSVSAVGGWWPRTNTPEIDLVGVDNLPVAKTIVFAGSITWHTGRPFDSRDLADLQRDAVAVPGVHAGTLLVAVCPTGVEPGLLRTGGLAATWNSRDLLSAWPA